MSGLLFAVAPLFDQSNLFEAGTGGYAHYRVPAIAVSPRGTVMVLTEARKSSRGDWGPQDILMRRSRNGGHTWDEPRSIARVEGEIPPNPVALAQNLDKPGDTTSNNIVPPIPRRPQTPARGRRANSVRTILQLRSHRQFARA